MIFFITILRTWTPLRTVLHLSPEPMAVVNVVYMVADEDLVVEKFFIGSPVLENLDTKKILKDRRDLPEGAECSLVRSIIYGARRGPVRGMIIALIKVLGNGNVHILLELAQGRPRVDYLKVRKDLDLFPDASLSELVN